MDALISGFDQVLSWIWFLLPPAFILIVVVALISRILKLRGSSSASAAIQEPGPESSSPSHRGLRITGIVLGVIIFFGALALAALVAIVATIFGSTPPPGLSSILLTILLVGTALAAFMVAGGWVALRSSDPVIIRRGALAQAIPAALVTGLVLIYVVFQFVLPNVGSGRYYHDYFRVDDLADEIQSSLADQEALHGVTINYIYIVPGDYASELGFDDSDDTELYLIDYLCERNGVEPRTQRSRAVLECSLVALQFKRDGITYYGHVPIHNRIDEVVDARTYKAVVRRRVIALWELDASHWIGSGEKIRELNYRDSAPFLTQ